MRQNPRVRFSKPLLPLLAIAVLALAGCGDTSSTGNPEVDQRSANDAAYEAIAAAQIENAENYSNAILSTTTNEQIRSLAEQVVAERGEQTDLLNRLRKTGEPVDIAKASHTLDISLSDLGVSADGKPMAAPSSDAGYVAAMKANLEGAILAAQAEIGDGGPGTTQLANRVYSTATAELEQLKAIKL